MKVQGKKQDVLVSIEVCVEAVEGIRVNSAASYRIGPRVSNPQRKDKTQIRRNLLRVQSDIKILRKYVPLCLHGWFVCFWLSLRSNGQWLQYLPYTHFKYYFV
jgi:hypothetical protein